MQPVGQQEKHNAEAQENSPKRFLISLTKVKMFHLYK